MHTLPVPHKEFPKRGGGFRNLTKKLKKFMKLNLNFPEGKGAGEKNLPHWGGVDIFWNYYTFLSKTSSSLSVLTCQLGC